MNDRHFGNPTGIESVDLHWDWLGIPTLYIFSFFRYSGAYIIYSLLNWREKKKIWFQNQLVAISAHCKKMLFIGVHHQMGSLPYDSWRRLLATVSHHNHGWCHWSCKIKSDFLIFFRSLKKLKSHKMENDKWFNGFVQSHKKNPTIYRHAIFVTG